MGKIFKMEASEGCVATRACAILVCVKLGQTEEDAKALALDILRKGEELDSSLGRTWDDIAKHAEPGEVYLIEDWDTTPDSPTTPIEIDDCEVWEGERPSILSTETDFDKLNKKLGGAA